MIRQRQKRLSSRARVITAALATSSLVRHGGSKSQLFTEAQPDSKVQDETQKKSFSKQLVTTYDSDRSSSGFMFDITSKKAIAIQGMDVNAIKNSDGNSNSVRIEIWTKKGTYQGKEEIEDAWTLWTNKTIATNGLDMPTSILSDIFTPIKISSKERRSFYVSFPEGAYLRYSTNVDGKSYYQNEELVLFANGAAKRRGFEGSAISPRLFSGALHYEEIPINEAGLISSPTPETTTTQPTIPSPTSQPSDAPSAETKSFTTTFEHSLSYAGNMFDIYARNNIEISSIAFHTFKTDYITIQIYTKEGSYENFDKDLDGWTLLANVAVKGQGLGNPTYIPEGAFPPILVRRNNRQAFYITSDGPNLRASKGISSKEGSLYKSNSDIRIYEGAGKRYPIEDGTFTPRIWNGELIYQVVYIPTASPTTAEPTALPTSSPTMSSFGPFRIRLWWTRGYYWQESYREMWYCMECRGQCRDNDSVYVDHCGRSSRQQFTVVGDTIRPASDLSLCLTTTGYYTEDKPLRVRRCGKDNGQGQQFEGFQPSGRFELQPKGKTGLCLSQMHHPKPYERVYPESCSKTRKHDTTYWITY